MIGIIIIAGSVKKSIKNPETIRENSIQIIDRFAGFQNMGIGGLLFKAQLELAINYNDEYICGISLDGKLSHWLKYGFEEYGELQRYKNFGIFKWITMKIKQIAHGLNRGLSAEN